MTVAKISIVCQGCYTVLTPGSNFLYTFGVLGNACIAMCLLCEDRCGLAHVDTVTSLDYVTFMVNEVRGKGSDATLQCVLLGSNPSLAAQVASIMAMHATVVDLTSPVGFSSLSVIVKPREVLSYEGNAIAL